MGQDDEHGGRRLEGQCGRDEAGRRTPGTVDGGALALLERGHERLEVFGLVQTVRQIGQLNECSGGLRSHFFILLASLYRSRAAKLRRVFVLRDVLAFQRIGGSR